jgi:hypothetical protein
MNDHIYKGNQALKNGDIDGARAEYAEALKDSDLQVQRIARNRLLELISETLYGSKASRLYHRENCPARNVTFRKNFMTFRDWRDAESRGYAPCPHCKPRRSDPQDLLKRK